jgi:pimeloyl-ACP methyl ester carboxylesterase
VTGPPEDGLPRAPEEGVVDGIAYGEWPGREPAFLLLHGISANYRAFLALGPRLAPHRVVALDMRGRGRSRQDGPTGLAQHGRDAAAVAEALGLERPVLAGHSLGGYVAAVAAADWHAAPLSALALLDGGVWTPWDVPEALVREALATSIGRLDRSFPSLDDYAAWWKDAPLALPDTPARRSQQARDLVGEPGAYRSATSAERFTADLRDILHHPERNRLLARVDVPVLVLQAPLGLMGFEATAMIPPEAMAAGLREQPALRSLDLPGANHFDMVEPPHVDRVATALLDLAAT